MATLTRTISDLQEIATVTDEHVLIVEDGIKTNKVTKANLLKEIKEQLTNELSNKVDKSVYDAKVADLQTDINNRLMKSEYDTKVAELQTDINSRVLTTDYTSKVAELQSGIDSKVATVDYNIKVAELQTDINSRLLSDTYNTKMTDLDGKIAANTTNITDNKTAFDTFKTNAESRISALETATLSFRVIEDEAVEGSAESGNINTDVEQSTEA